MKLFKVFVNNFMGEGPYCIICKITRLLSLWVISLRQGKKLNKVMWNHLEYVHYLDVQQKVQ